MPAPVTVRFDGFAFPVWVVVASAVEAELGESAATHYLTGDADEKLLPLFTTEAAAAGYAQRNALAGYNPAAIADPTDLLIRLEQFRTRGGTHVGIDIRTSPDAGTVLFDLADFIRHVRAG